MAVAKDTIASNFGHNASAASVCTVSVTVGSNNNRALYAWVGMNGASGVDLSSITYNSVAMTLLATVAVSGTDQRFSLYRLLAPATGTHNLVATSNQTDCIVCVSAESLYNVDQTTPETTAQLATITGTGIVSAGAAGAASGYAMGCCFSWASTSTTLTDANGIGKFISAGALSTASSVTGRTPAAPSGRMPGDLELASCSSENNATHSCSSTGWYKINQTNSGSGWTVSYWYRIYDGTNVDPAITWTGAADADAQRECYRDGKISGTPISAIGTVGTGLFTPHTSTGANTTAANSLAIYSDNSAGNTAIATPSGWTEDFDGGSATGPCRAAGGHKEVATSGSATGNISVSGATAAAWVQQQFELLAAAAGVQSQEDALFVNSVFGQQRQNIATETADAYNAFGWTVGGTGVYTAQCGAVCALPATFTPTPRFSAQLVC